MEYRRGGWRGFSRGRGRGRGQGSWRTGQHRAPSPPVGRALKELTVKSLVVSAGDESNVPVISNCQLVGSYNWIGSVKNPSMLIPGGPPAWTPLDDPTELKEDSGVFYRDVNAARYPEYPMEPAVRTFAARTIPLPTEGVDIFACGSTLGNLIRFVRKVDKPFRFTVEAIGNTVFFVRKENSPTEAMEGVRGYGHTFPDAYTTWEEEIAGSQSHQRLINYDFAGLNCVVRFEGDGYLPQFAPDPEKAADSSDTAPPTTKLDIRRGGHMVSQDAIFDLKTRSVKRMEHDVLGEELPRLWVAQVPNFILAYHNRGLFEDIRVQNVRRDIEKWEIENESSLRQLAKLIREISATAKSRADKRLEVRRKDVHVLEIREQLPSSPGALPDALKAWWAEGSGVGHASSHEDWSSGDDGINDEERYFSDGVDGGGGVSFDSDDESVTDYTACSAEDCGYCGHCRY